MLGSLGARLGLRAQIVAALGVLLAVAFSLLGFAVVSLSRAALVRSRTAQDHAVSRAIASELNVALAENYPAAAIDAIAARALADATLRGVLVVGPAGEPLARRVRGTDPFAGFDPRRGRPSEEQVEIGGETVLLLATPIGLDRGVLVVAASVDEAVAGLRPMERLSLFYVAASALALLVFGYIALTRLIVQPLDALKRAAEQVAQGRLDVHVEPAAVGEIGRLGEAFNEMTRTLERQRRALQEQMGQLVRTEKLASVGRLAAGVAHEIGNPIAAVLGFIDLLNRGDATTEESRDALQRMKRETERVNRIVTDLLQFARGERAATADRLESASVRAVVDDAVQLLSAQPRLREVEVQAALPEDLPAVRGSAERLGQVLVNLLLNAADAMHGKGAIGVTAEHKGDRVLVRVTDSGPGILPEHLTEIFDPFFTTKEPGEGTGLGLAVCQGIVQSVGGEISASNGPSGGAVFTVSLPISSGSGA